MVEGRGEAAWNEALATIPTGGSALVRLGRRPHVDMTSATATAQPEAEVAAPEQEVEQEPSTAKQLRDLRALHAEMQAHQNNQPGERNEKVEEMLAVLEAQMADLVASGAGVETASAAAASTSHVTNPIADVAPLVEKKQHQPEVGSPPSSRPPDMSPLVGQQQQDWEEQVEVDYLVRLQLLENGGFGFGISQGNPCEVSAVQSNTLAEQLGVRMGDVIVAIAGVACRDVQD
jgi:hypothetical protein